MEGDAARRSPRTLSPVMFFRRSCPDCAREKARADALQATVDGLLGIIARRLDSPSPLFGSSLHDLKSSAPNTGDVHEWRAGGWVNPPDDDPLPPVVQRALDNVAPGNDPERLSIDAWARERLEEGEPEQRVATRIELGQWSDETSLDGEDLL